MITRRLGKTQTRLLYLLAERKHWYEGCGWNYGTASNTFHVLESLVKYGVVVKMGYAKIPGVYDGFELTDLGREYLAERDRYHESISNRSGKTVG
jgi:hypothetical protein